MGLQDCQIIFDNSSGIYFAGQTLSGRVEIKFDSPKKVRGISIQIKGLSQTHWQEHESSHTDGHGKRESRTVQYHGDEEYFKIMYYVIGGPNSDSIELPPGTHTYPFTCAIPPTAPSSFEGTYGHVRYTVKVTLDRPWKFDHTSKVAFTVIANVDLNVNSRIREPATLTVEKYFCCCWCRSGPLTGVIKVPCTGFVPGQAIPFTIEVDNASNIDVDGIKIQLKKLVTYSSQRPRRHIRRDAIKITEVNVGAVAGRGSNTWSQNLTVPALPASNLTNCHIIDLDYEIKIEILVAGFHQNVVGNLPIMIGTIPLVNMTPMPVQSTQTVIQMNDSMNTATRPVVGWVPVPLNESVDPYSLPPPTYEQCQFGTASIEDNTDSEYTKFNQKEYTPRYPVYNFNMSSTPQFAPTAPIS